MSISLPGTDMVTPENLSFLYKNRLSAHKTKLLASREALIAAGARETGQDLLAINEELLSLVDELLADTQRIRPGTANQELAASTQAEEERNQLLVDLGNERNLWQTTVESLLDPVTVCDAQGKAIYMNKTYERLLQMQIHQGLDLEQHSDYYHIYHPDGRPFAARDLPLQKAALENKNVRNVEMVQHSSTGQKYYLLWNASPLRNAEGAAIGAVAIGHDITAQRAAEAAQARLFEENQRQKELLENIFAVGPVGIAVISGDDFTIHMANSAYQKMLPHPEINPVGKRVEDVWSPDEGFRRVCSRSRKVQNNESPQIFKLDTLFPDNSRRIYSFHLQPLSHSGDKNVLSVVWDMTGIELAREEAEEGRRTLEALMNQIPEGITITDAPEVKVRMISQYACDLIGLKFEEIVGKPRSEWWKIYDPVSGIRATYEQMPLSRVTLTGEVIRDEEWLLENEQGEQIPILCNAGPIRNQSGEISGGILAWRDITERKMAEDAINEFTAQLIEYSEQLEARVRERTRELVDLQHHLVDNVEAERLWVAQELHDGPMQEIYGLLYKLASLKEADDSSQWQVELVSFQEQLKQVNESLRSVARELRPVSLTPFGLEKAIREHGEKFSREHPELHISLDLMEDGTRLPEHLRLSLFRIYQTALTNVIRHAHADHIWVSFSYDEEGVLLEIRDDGVGFVVPNRLITLTQQGHLGLAGAVERAEAMGGKLEVESEPGKGTRLRVLAPLKKEEAI